MWCREEGLGGVEDGVTCSPGATGGNKTKGGTPGETLCRREEGGRGVPTVLVELQYRLRRAGKWAQSRSRSRN